MLVCVSNIMYKKKKMERENRVDKCDQLVENLTASDDHDLTCWLHPLSFSTFTLCRPLSAEHDDEVTLRGPTTERWLRQWALLQHEQSIGLRDVVDLSVVVVVVAP